MDHHEADGELIPLQFEWKISTDQLKSAKKYESINSPKFSLTSTTKDKNNSWYLSLYPEGGNYQTGYMEIYLYNDNDYDVTVSYTLSLMNNNREIIASSKYVDQKVSSQDGYGEENFIYKALVLNPINNLIKDNKITVVCTLHEISARLQNINQNYIPGQSTIEKIFENKKYSDITIVSADGIEFFLHKCILAAQSSVFEAMFDTDMMEKKENLVKIYDFDSSVLNEFFNYLYTGKLGIKRVKDLLIVAEKYNVEKLKEHCEITMSNKVNVDRAIDYLEVAESNNAQKLRSNVIQYMASNLKKIKEQAEFESISAKKLREIIDCHIELMHADDGE